LRSMRLRYADRRRCAALRRTTQESARTLARN